MNETPFFKTRMGQRFFEHTVPGLVRQIERLNELLERLVAAQPNASRENVSRCQGCEDR